MVGRAAKLAYEGRTVNADVGISNSGFNLKLRAQRRRKMDVRINRLHERRACTHERERNRVASLIAALQVSSSIVRMRRLRMVLMSGEPVRTDARTRCTAMSL